MKRQASARSSPNYTLIAFVLVCSVIFGVHVWRSYDEVPVVVEEVVVEKKITNEMGEDEKAELLFNGGPDFEDPKDRIFQFYDRWTSLLEKKIKSNETYPSQKKLYGSMVRQGLRELSWYINFPHMIDTFASPYSEKFIAFEGIVPGQGINHIRVALTLLFLYGHLTNRTVVLPETPHAPLHFLDFANSYSKMKVHAKAMNLRLVSKLPASLDNAVQHLNFPYFSVETPVPTVGTNDIQDGFNWDDIELVYALSRFQGTLLILPYMFCNRVSSVTAVQRQRLLSSFVHSSQIRDQAQRIVAALSSQSMMFERNRALAKPTQSLNYKPKKGYFALHIRTESHFEPYCQVSNLILNSETKNKQKLSPNPNIDLCYRWGPQKEGTEHLCIPSTGCFMQPKDIVERIVRNAPSLRLPGIIYLVGGKSVTDNVLKQKLRANGFQVYSKFDFLPSTFGLKDSAAYEYVNSAIDFEVSLNADTFLGTAWSSFGFTIATIRDENSVGGNNSTLYYSEADTLQPFCSGKSFCFYPCLFVGAWDIIEKPGSSIKKPKNEKT